MIDSKSVDAPRRWDVAIVLFGTSLVAIVGVPLYGYFVGYEPWLWAGFVAMTLWNGLSITAGYHRLWSHKSYEARPLVRLIFALGGALALQNSIRVWCADHRNHHRYTDDLDKDPYSAKRGFWYSHLGWMLRDYPATDRDFKNIRDLDRDPIVVWQDTYYWTLAFCLNVLLTLVIGYAMGDALGGLLVLGFLRLVTCHHTTFFINSLAHTWGSQPYSDSNSSRDNPVIAFLTYGEGFHNFHHTFQWDYRNGIRWYHFDPTKWVIKALSWCNLTYDLKRIPPEKIEQSIAAMQLKKATEKIVHYRLVNHEQWLELLETEYNQLVQTLNAWAKCRQDWMELKKADMKRRWDDTEIRKQLLELEENLHWQRKNWRMLTQQFV